MVSKRNVLLLSYELNKNAQRGIYQFSKALVDGINANNYNLGFFTQVYSVQNGLDEINRCLLDPRKYFLNENSMSKLLLHYLKNKVVPEDFSITPNNNFNCDILIDVPFLKKINFFINKPVFYYENNMDLIFPHPFYEKNIELAECSNNDIIFTTSPLAIKSSKHRVVQTVHDLIPLEEKNKFYKYFLKRLSSCNGADKVLAVSNYSKNKFLEIFPKMEDRTHVVYQPLPVDENIILLSLIPEIQNKVLDKYKLKPKQYMYYVGAVEKRKNIHNLIKAYINATKFDKNIPLVISGSLDSDYVDEYDIRKYFSDVKNYNLSKFNILKTDFVTDLEKLCLIRNSRAFLFPSLSEGFGIPVLEAQSLGVPVLTSNNTSLPEVTYKSALMLDNPLNIEEIKTNIENLWADEKLCLFLSELGLENSKRFTKDQFRKSLGVFLMDL